MFTVINYYCYSIKFGWNHFFLKLYRHELYLKHSACMWINVSSVCLTYTHSLSLRQPHVHYSMTQKDVKDSTGIWGVHVFNSRCEYLILGLSKRTIFFCDPPFSELNPSLEQCWFKLNMLAVCTLDCIFIFRILSYSECYFPEDAVFPCILNFLSPVLQTENELKTTVKGCTVLMCLLQLGSHFKVTETYHTPFPSTYMVGLDSQKGAYWTTE